jgi:Sugar (and other) transporter
MPFMQAVPLFLSEVAPAKLRGGLNILFQLNITVGILFAALVNYGASKYTSNLFSYSMIIGPCAVLLILKPYINVIL